MKLAAPEFERRMRRLVCAEMRQSRPLWKEYKRRKTSWRQRNLGQLDGRAVGSYFILIALVRPAFASTGGALIWLNIALYATATALYRGNEFRQSFTASWESRMRLVFPLSDKAFFEVLWTRFIKSWCGAFALFFIAHAFLLMFTGFGGWQVPLAAVMAALQSLCGLSLATLLMVYYPRALTAQFAIPIFFLMLGVNFLRATIVKYVWPAALLTPGGWIEYGYAAFKGTASISQSLWLLPALALAAALPFAYRKLRSFFAVRELQESPTAVEAEMLAAEEMSEDDECWSVSSMDLPSDPEALPPAEWRTGYYATPDWTRSGLVERIVGAWLTPREKTVAEFMLSNNVGRWSQEWRWSWIISAVGIVLAILLPAVPSWVHYLAMAAAAILGAPWRAGAWEGFHDGPGWGVVAPMYATLPLSYDEVSRVLFKANLVTTLVWAPACIGYAAAAQLGAATGIEMVIVVLALQPAMIAGRFFGATDLHNVNWQIMTFISLGVAVVGIWIAALIAFFVQDDPRIGIEAIAAMFVSSTLVWLAYKWLSNRGKVGLLAAPSPR